MGSVIEIFGQSGFANMTWGNWVMYLVAGVLIFLAIRKEYEPLLLIPIGFGIVLANFPLAEMGSYAHGIIGLIYEGGIKTELLPPIIFLGVGVLTDFRPLLGRPVTFLLGASAHEHQILVKRDVGLKNGEIHAGPPAPSRTATTVTSSWPRLWSRYRTAAITVGCRASRGCGP